MKTRFIVAVFVTFTTYVHGQTFEPKVFDWPGSAYFDQCHWIDFNADGAFDILAIDFYSKATLHIADGEDFTSTNLAIENLHFEEGRHAFSDYDGDGDIDMLATQANAIVIVDYDGTNDLSLVNTGITLTNADYGKIYWIDIDGDLVLDIILGQRIFLNDQGVYSESRFTLPEMLSNVVWDDLNGDGLNDLIAGGYESYDGTEVSIFLNKGEGYFLEAATTLPNAKLQSSTITLLDADGDTDIDIFARDLYSRGWIYENTLAQTGTMTFTGSQIVPDINLLRAVAGDINSDGLEDLVVVGQASLTVLKNTSATNTISFTRESYAVQMESFNSLTIVDIDGDKKLDIHVVGYSGQNGYENVIFENIGAPAGPTPTVPVNLSSAIEMNTSLSWNAVPRGLYNIEVKRNGIIYKPSSTSPSGRALQTTGSSLLRNNTLVLRGLPSGAYEWRVQAVNPSGVSSAFSVANTFHINVAPSSLTLQASDLKKVKLCWSYTGTDNPSFSIFRGTSLEGTVEIAQVGAGITCYEDSSVPENQHMEYYVVAVNAGIYSASSNTVAHHSTLFVESSFGMSNPNIIAARCFPGDFDMDGDYDLEFIGRVGSFDNNFLLKNNGTGSYTPHGAMLTGREFFPYTELQGARDIDNDGDPDMIVITGSDYSWQKVSVFINNNGTFAIGFETPAYLGIFQLAVEDLNNDGRLDLLFSNNTGNSSNNARQYQLLYQRADGGFEDSHIVFSNIETTTVATFKCIDLNRDGFLDILWASADNKFTDILVNEGGMGFTKKTSILPVTYAMGVADYTGDGYIDVMVQGNEGLHLYFGAENFTFKEPKVIPIQYNNGSTFLNVDIDLNGWPDLLLSDGHYSQVVLNKGNGSFKSSDIELQSDWGSSIAITDFENDGDIDIVKLGNDYQHQGLNYLYRNQLADINVVNAPPTSPGSLSATYGYGKTKFTWSASTDDRTPVKVLTYNLFIVDSNGKVWLHPETNASGTFRTRMGHGNNDYSTVKTLNHLPAGVYTTRVQAIDASFALSSWSQETQLTIHEGPKALTIERILLNKIKLTWSGSPYNETNVVVQRRAVGNDWEIIAELSAGSASYTDANLVYNTLYQYRVFESSGSESTASSDVAEWNTNMWVLQDTDIANLYGSMDVADFTGDGRMDMVLNGGMIYNGYTEDITRATFENTSGGWVKSDITPSNLSHTSQIAFNDLNGDSNPDIYQHGYLWDSGYKTETFLNNGNKTFSSATNFLTDQTYAIESYFDFDMDNDLDVSVVKAGSYPTVREVYQNKGGGSYNSVETMTCYSCPQDVAVADFDGDGDEDVIRYVGGNYQLYQNTSGGLVATSVSFPSYENKIAVADYNDDGLSDIMLLTSSYYRTGKIHKNLGSLQFEELQQNLSSGDQSLLSADFDHDGHTDLVVIAPKVNVLLNTGDDTFQEYIEPGFQISLNVSKIIDFDNDGDLDIYLSGYHIQNSSYYGRKAKILLNQTIVSAKGITNVPPVAPIGLSSMQDSLGVHLSWNKSNDDHTQPGGITYDVVLLHTGKTITKGDHNPATGQRLRLTRGRSTGIATFNNLLVGPYSYRVQAIDGSFAASGFSAEGTFTFLPPPPVMNDTLINSCGRTITLVAKGTDIKWYKDNQLTQLLASGQFHPTETQTVYVTQTIDGYRGLSNRVQIVINEKPPLPVFSQANPYPICEGPGFQMLWVAGENVKWYSDQSLTSLLANTSDLQITSSNATYFATQTIQGCSSNALAVEVKTITIDSKLYYANDKIWTQAADADFFYWYRDGLYYRYTTVPYITFDGEIATYTVSVYKGQCQENAEPFLSSPENVTAVEEIPESLFDVFPNPSSSHVTLKPKSTSAITNITIFDSLGKWVYSTSVDGNEEQTLNASRWTKGVYVMIVEHKKKIYAKRLVLF
jgi:hypothetical protein